MYGKHEVCYLSTVCGKFLRRNGVSVQVVCSCKPLEFIKRHPEHFVLCGAGHVALRKDENLPEVRFRGIRDQGIRDEGRSRRSL